MGVHLVTESGVELNVQACKVTIGLFKRDQNPVDFSDIVARF